MKFAIFILLLAQILCNLLAIAGSANCPNFMNRDQWGARPAKDRSEMDLPVPYVVIHHSVMGAGNCSYTPDCIRTMQEIQDFHMDNRTWSDVGYTFLVGGDGFVYEGRGWNTQGAHAPPYNGNSIGICLIGDFTNILPPYQQLEAAKSLISCGVESGYITSDYILLGHRDTGSTACPGDVLYREISKWPHKRRNEMLSVNELMN